MNGIEPYESIEIELRYEIVDKNQLTQFLAPLKFLRSNQDIDILL